MMPQEKRLHDLILRHKRHLSRRFLGRPDGIASADSTFSPQHRQTTPEGHTKDDEKQTASEQSNTLHLTYRYGSRSLSLQIEAIRHLFPDDPTLKATHILSSACSDQPNPITNLFEHRHQRHGDNSSGLFSSLAHVVQQNDYLLHPTDVAAPPSSMTSWRISESALRSSPILTFEDRRSSLSRKPDVFDLHRASTEGHTRRRSFTNACVHEGANGRRPRPLLRSDLDKPLPPVPSETPDTASIGREKSNHSDLPMVWPSPWRSKTRSPASSATIHRHYAPAVTHEVITRRVHEIREEHITRETQIHEYCHRALPVIELDIRPTRYFLADEDGHVEEVEEDRVPTELRPSREEIASTAMARLDASRGELIDVQSSAPEVGLEAYLDGVAFDEAEAGLEEVQRRKLTRVHTPLVKPAQSGVDEKHSILILDFNNTLNEQPCLRTRSREGSGQEQPECFL